MFALTLYQTLSNYSIFVAQLLNKQLSVELKDSEKTLIQDLSQLGQMVGALSHDLNNPMAALSNGISCLKHSIQADLEKKHQLDILRHMDSAVQVNASVLDSMSVSASLLKGQSLSNSVSVIDLRCVLDNAIQCCQLVFCHAQIDTVFEAGLDEVSIYADEALLSRSLLNLLSNAARYDGAILAKVQFCTDSSKPNCARDCIEFSVTDNGPGVAKELRSSMWQPLVTGSASTGLGLFVVQHYASTTGGYCGMHENAPTGSVFWFRIPYLQAVSCRSSSENSVQVASSRRHPRVTIDYKAATLKGTTSIVLRDTGKQELSDDCIPTILIIDDISVILEMTALELQTHGFEVHKAHGAPTGLEMLKRRSYSAVICDYSMPCLNGDDLVTIYRDWEVVNRPGVEQLICVISANMDAQMKSSCLQAGVQGILSKPIDANQLRKCIRDNEATQHWKDES